MSLLLLPLHLLCGGAETPPCSASSKGNHLLESLCSAGVSPLEASGGDVHWLADANDDANDDANNLQQLDVFVVRPHRVLLVPQHGGCWFSWDWSHQLHLQWLCEDSSSSRWIRCHSALMFPPSVFDSSLTPRCSCWRLQAQHQTSSGTSD